MPQTCLSLFTFCKGRRSEVERWLPSAIAATGECDEIIIVDYDDPEHVGDWAVLQHAPRLTIVQIYDCKWFHAAHARNLALRACRGQYAISCDSDYLVTPEVVQECRSISQGGFLVQNDAVGSMGFLVAATADLLEIQGWEEGVCGYGFEDLSLRDKLVALGRKRITMTARLQDIGARRQVRIMQAESVARNAAVNRRLLRTLGALHRYKNNFGRNWGAGGEILQQAGDVIPCSPCGQPVHSQTDSSNSSTPSPTDAGWQRLARTLARVPISS